LAADKLLRVVPYETPDADTLRLVRLGSHS
jgi:hypothetical protein